MPSEVEGHLFFDFLSLRSTTVTEGTSPCKFGFAWLLDNLPQDSDTGSNGVIAMLVRIQENVFTEWLDKLRSPASLEFAKKAIPQRLQLDDFAVISNWCLVLRT